MIVRMMCILMVELLWLVALYIQQKTSQLCIDVFSGVLS